MHTIKEGTLNAVNTVVEAFCILKFLIFLILQGGRDIVPYDIVLYSV